MSQARNAHVLRMIAFVVLVALTVLVTGLIQGESMGFQVIYSTTK
jgi:hypothetical protein